ncbi:hypothetical protein ANO11243_093440 [Dothideomycetidae sp. 11243]|nr:hypothetical protein ANO11243_093440 [fungal sp. No.11243]
MLPTGLVIVALRGGKASKPACTTDRLSTDADVAKLVRKLLSVNFDGGYERGRYSFVESRIIPSHETELDFFRQTTGDDKKLETDFIGCSAEECQRWAAKAKDKVPSIDRFLFAIADAYGAETGTILLQRYAYDQQSLWKIWGKLPQRSDTWYSFRIRHGDYDDAMLALELVWSPKIYPTFFALKEHLTDEDGIFDVESATRLTRAKLGRFHYIDGSDDGTNVQ